MSRIVFDIGATNMRVARADTSTIETEEKIKTPQNPEEAFIRFTELVTSISASEKITALSGGVPGIVDNNGTILKLPNLPKWNGFPFGGMLSDSFSIPVHVHNDSEMIGLGEANFGAGSDANIVAYIGIGTGVGGTRIVNKSITKHSFGYEPGHQIIDIENNTTLESFVSGKSLIEKYNKQPKDISRDIWDKLTPILAVGIWNTIVHWSPDVVVLGGSLMNEDNGFRIKDIEKALENKPFIYPEKTPIYRAMLGDYSGLYGAMSILDKHI